MPGLPLETIAAELGFPLPGSGSNGGLMSSFTNAHKYPLILEQVDPATNQVLQNGLRYQFEEDDLPDDLPLGGPLHTKQMVYPNNTIPDTQVIRTSEHDIELKGHFWSFDRKGRSPMDKAELLDAMRLAGFPVKLSYMGSRIVRYCFIHDFRWKIHDETDVEWEMDLEVYKHGNQAGASGNLNAPLTSNDNRIQDIVARLNSHGQALLELEARIASTRNTRGLRTDLAGTIPSITQSLQGIAAARNAFQQASSIEQMTVQQFKDFANRVEQVQNMVKAATTLVRDISTSPATAAERALGWSGQFQRRQLLREVSITTNRIQEDLALMKKDAERTFSSKQTVHVVSDNDTLRSISYQYYGTSDRWQDIAKANSITDPVRITGQTLIIPK